MWSEAGKKTEAHQFFPASRQEKSVIFGQSIPTISVFPVKYSGNGNSGNSGNCEILNRPTIRRLVGAGS